MKKTILVLSLLASFYADAQTTFPTQEQFGKNRIQYRPFHWKVLSTQNFEVYYYEGGQQNATLAIQMAESEFDRITDVLGYSPFNRTKIFVYNATSDLNQSNVGLSLSSEKEIREENLAKSRIEIAYSGSATMFRKELTREISRVFIHDMLYGGSIKESLQNSLLLSVPEWFISGISQYIAEGWSTELDSYMSDAIINKFIKRPNQTAGREAGLIGQSVWNYIAERYGRENISNILNLTRIIRNEQTSISSTLGMPFSRFLKEWREFYTSNAEATIANYTLPQYDFKIGQQALNAPNRLNQFKISPDGNFLALTRNDLGRSSVEVVNLKTKRTETILSSGFKTLNQSIDHTLPLVSWTKGGSLAVIFEDRGDMVLYLFSDISEKDLSGKLQTKRVLKNFAQISDFDISDAGTQIVFSAESKGQNDLFLLDVARSSVSQLTNDLYDDLNPQFVGSAGKVVFVSNRLKDSLEVDKGTHKSVTNPFKLFLHEGKPKAETVKVLVDSLGNISHPVVADGNTIYFLSDEKGIRNIYKLIAGENEPNLVSTFRTDIISFDYALSSNSLVYRFIDNNQDIIAYQKNADLGIKSNIPFTNRNVRLFGAPIVNAVKPNNNATKPTETPKENSSQPSIKLLPGEIDTDNYQFDDNATAKAPASNTADKKNDRKTRTERILSSKQARKDNIKIKGPTDYNNAFVVNGTETDFVVDPLPQRGFGLNANLKMNDLLENHLLKTGLFLTPNLKNSDLWAEYSYLAQKIDYSVRFDRRTTSDDGEVQDTKYRLNKVTFSAAYPINTNSRVSISTNFITTRYYEFDLNTSVIAPYLPTINADYVGARAEYVYDNTISHGLNQLEGTRFKVRYDHYTGVTSASDGFEKINVDIRHYIRLGKGTILAFRGAGGHSFGNAPKATVMGGADNWIGRTYEATNNKNNPFNSSTIEKDLFFLDYATPLRGFNMNKIAGNSFMALNAEVRFPIAKYLYSGPIYSNFFKNLQLTGFTDVGTAWTGVGPFSRRNAFNTYVLPNLTPAQIANGENIPFRATITDFRSPFLVGYGIGARTTILGYFVKFDIGWGLENKEVKAPISYLTLGYDF
ncbi:hypothetical protein [Flectobacillus roseus]|uniref:Translocation protein TolB n=1 Tax=Flectobacillus roseus TaxID=502259 RepID=A0ABT6YEC7_9BACT|nr:hypothetical protein [Flectobacillus roseus]MDI9861536.1 hypothetical protein [Flectobacillus roseus]MDI9868700.1 hypothetical protein [Flectobacillus roseus]